jgi:hypothetical protein
MRAPLLQASEGNKDKDTMVRRSSFRATSATNLFRLGFLLLLRLFPATQANVILSLLGSNVN